jgi:ABC-2 type transport system permease protein
MNTTPVPTSIPTPPALNPSLLTRLWVNLKSELLILFRNPAALIPTVLFPIMFWFFFGLPNANSTTKDGIDKGSYVLASYATYSIIQTVLFNLGIFIASERADGWYRLRRTTPVSIATVLTSKILGVFVLGLMTLVLLLVVGAVSASISLPIEAWLNLVAWVMVGALPFIALACCIGYLATGANSASPIINLIFFPMAFGSGLFIPLSALPKLVQDIAVYLPTYHAGELARMAVGIPSNQDLGVHVLWVLGYTVGFLALAAWAYQRDEGSNYR